MPRGRFRTAPVHNLVQRLWDKYKIGGPREAAQISGESVSAVSLTADKDRIDALRERIEHTAEKIGVRPVDFMTEMLADMQEKSSR